MFDEIGKNNFCKNIVYPTKFLNDDNKVDSNVPIDNDQIILKIEEKFNEGELILDGIKFKGIEDIKKDPIFLQMKNLSESPINEIEMSTVSKQKSLKFSERLALSRLNKDIKSKRPQLYEYQLENKETLFTFGHQKTDHIQYFTELTNKHKHSKTDKEK